MPPAAGRAGKEEVEDQENPEADPDTVTEPEGKGKPGGPEGFYARGDHQKQRRPGNQRARFPSRLPHGRGAGEAPGNEEAVTQGQPRLGGKDDGAKLQAAVADDEGEKGGAKTLVEEMGRRNPKGKAVKGEEEKASHPAEDPPRESPKGDRDIVVDVEAEHIRVGTDIPGLKVMGA